MAQAECITTAIRELMSRGGPPKSTSPMRAAHTEFVATLAGNVPHPIYAAVDSDDLDARADHVEKLLAATHVYLTAILADTEANIAGGRVRAQIPRQRIQRLRRGSGRRHQAGG
jgi:hypothetical protein